MTLAKINMRTLSMVRYTAYGAGRHAEVTGFWRAILFDPGDLPGSRGTPHHRAHSGKRQTLPPLVFFAGIGYL
jgi:hypothetical protein